jgi:hypothetical protein
MPTSYISFLADINPITSAALVATVFEEVRKGATKFILCFLLQAVRLIMALLRIIYLKHYEYP